jgi:prepilin-type N-terminal cleavage/methylation domain-containing protein
MRPPRSHAGFSLVDVLIAVIIFGILSTIVLAALRNLRRDATRREATGTPRLLSS